MHSSLFSPLVTFFKTVIQNHNQLIDIDSVQVHNIFIIIRISPGVFLATPISAHLHSVFNHKPILCFYHFDISELSHKQNHMVYNHMGLAFFPLWRFMHFCIYQQSLFVAELYSMVWVQQWITIYLWVNIWIVSVFSY